jgi:hypothetical protein
MGDTEEDKNAPRFGDAVGSKGLKLSHLGRMRTDIFDHEECRRLG